MTGTISRDAFIGGDVELGTGVTVAPFAVLNGPGTVGDYVWIGPHATIGTPAQIRQGDHPALGADAGDARGFVIGDRTVIREHATVHQGSESQTSIGTDCYIMFGAHVPHDAFVGDGVTLSNMVQLGGHTWIGVGANLGLGTVAHQRSVIGAYSMIGMGSVVTRPIPPFAVAYGAPAKVAGTNHRRLEQLGIDDTTIRRWSDVLAAGGLAGEDGPEPYAGYVHEYLARLGAIS